MRVCAHTCICMEDKAKYCHLWKGLFRMMLAECLSLTQETAYALWEEQSRASYPCNHGVLKSPQQVPVYKSNPYFPDLHLHYQMLNFFPTDPKLLMDFSSLALSFSYLLSTHHSLPIKELIV